jgi:hypothetical protein
MKIAAVTVSLGDYDTIKPVTPQEGIDFICVTDGECPEGWKLYATKSDNYLRDSRYFKMMTHEYLKEYDLVIYFDGNCEVRKSLNQILKYYKGDALFTKHPKRNCIYQEALICSQIGKKGVIEHAKKYANQGFPEDFGLWQGGIFVRPHNEKWNNLFEQWYKEFREGVERDQIALPFVFWKNKVMPDILPFGELSAFYYSARHNHKAPKVWHITSGRGDKNLGGEINRQVALMPDEDWICLRDGDTMFLNEYWAGQIEDIVKNNSHFNLIGCMTNRVGLKWLCHEGKISEDPDVRNHYHIAKDLASKYYDKVEPLHNTIAGHFMLFPKRVWNQIKFPEGLLINNGFVDYHFSKAVLDQLGGLGIAKGVYLFHYYRFHKHKLDRTHLI